MAVGRYAAAHGFANLQDGVGAIGHRHVLGFKAKGLGEPSDVCRNVGAVKLNPMHAAFAARMVLRGVVVSFAEEAEGCTAGARHRAHATRRHVDWRGGFLTTVGDGRLGCSIHVVNAKVVIPVAGHALGLWAGDVREVLALGGEEGHVLIAHGHSLCLPAQNLGVERLRLLCVSGYAAVPTESIRFKCHVFVLSL